MNQTHGRHQARRRTSLHADLTTLIRAEIVGPLAPGDRLPTISSLAGRYSVGDSTIRAVLLTLSQEGLLEMRQGSGCYVTDHSPAATPRLAVLTDWDIFNQTTSRFYTRILQMLLPRLRANGRGVNFYPGSRQIGENPATAVHEEFIADLRDGRLDGVVALASVLNGPWYDATRAAHLPLVTVGSQPQPGTVHLDYAEMTRLGTDWLIAQGRRRLALVGYGTIGRSGASGDLIRDAFCAALTAAGLTIEPAWIQLDLHPVLAGAGWEQFRGIWTARAERPDGLLVTDDLLFRDLLPALAEVDALPAVATHANREAPVAAQFPHARLEFSADEAAAALADLILHNPAGHVTLSCRLALDQAGAGNQLPSALPVNR